MKLSRRLTSAAVAIVLNAAPLAALAASAPAPVPAPTPMPMGFYIMQGRQIVSLPFTDSTSCVKMLLKIQKTVAPGNDTLVCVHRRP